MAHPMSPFEGPPINQYQIARLQELLAAALRDKEYIDSRHLQYVIETRGAELVRRFVNELQGACITKAMEDRGPLKYSLPNFPDGWYQNPSFMCRQCDTPASISRGCPELWGCEKCGHALAVTSEDTIRRNFRCVHGDDAVQGERDKLVAREIAENVAYIITYCARPSGVPGGADGSLKMALVPESLILARDLGLIPEAEYVTIAWTAESIAHQAPGVRDVFARLVFRCDKLTRDAVSAKEVAQLRRQHFPGVLERSNLA